jgi:tetratricopeptide (TPR) repeat protein
MIKTATANLLRLRFSVIGLILLMFFLAGCSKSARTERHLRRAQSYYAAHNHDAALIEFRNTLALDSRNALAHLGLGKIYYEKGAIKRAFEFLSNARKLGGSDLEGDLMLLRICRDANALSTARKLAIELIEKDPLNDEALVTLAEIARTPEEFADVLARVGKAPGRKEDRAIFYTVAGIASVPQKNWDKTEETLKRAVSMDPASRVARHALGTFFWMRGDLSHAEEQFQKEIAAAPQDRFARLHFAEFKMMTRSFSEARVQLESLTRDAPDFIPARSELAVLALEEGRDDDCAALSAKVLQEQPEDFRALLTQARLSLKQRKITEAIDRFKQVISYYEPVPVVHYELARTYLATNEFKKASLALDKAISLNPNFGDALFLKGQIDLRTGDNSSAAEIFTQLARLNPRLISAQLALADARRAEGKIEQAAEIYRGLTESYPTNSLTWQMLGMVYRQQQKNALAEDALLKAAQLNSTNAGIFNQLVTLKLETKETSSARQIAEDFLRKNPDNPAAWLIRARLHLAEKETNLAETLLSKAIQLDHSSPQPYELLAGIYVNSGRDADAVKKLDEALAQTPNSVSLGVQKALIQTGMSNYTAAAQSYETVLATSPDAVLVLNNLAALYSTYLPKPDRALKLANRAYELVPNNPSFADTLGWILYQQGEYDKAKPLLLTAANSLAASPEVQFHLGMLHYMRGEEPEAKARLGKALQANEDFFGKDLLLERLAILNEAWTDAGALERLRQLAKNSPADPVLLRRMADIHFRDGAWDKARELYEKVLDANPRSVEILIKLAIIHGEKLHDWAKALEAANRARSVEPDNAEVNHLLGRLRFISGEHQKSVSLLDDALQKGGPDPEVYCDLAWALYSVGRVEEARKNMQSALESKPSFSRGEEAKTFLLLTDASGTAEAARKTAGKILQSEGENVPALMILAAERNEEGKSDEARNLYRKVSQKYPDFGPVWRALLLLPRAAVEQSNDEFELATKARKAFPQDAAVAKAFGRALYDRGDFAAARRVLRECASSFEEDWEVHYYLGMACHKLGERAAAQSNLRRAAELGLPGRFSIEVTAILLEDQPATSGTSPERSVQNILEQIPSAIK